MIGFFTTLKLSVFERKTSKISILSTLLVVNLTLVKDISNVSNLSNKYRDSNLEMFQTTCWHFKRLQHGKFYHKHYQNTTFEDIEPFIFTTW